MGGDNGGMRAAARRDPEFRGIDPAALGRLVKQVQDAGTAVANWLNAHRPPPGVPAGGYRQAAQAEQWATGQVGMLERRRNYALTHPDRGDALRAAPPPPRMRGSTGPRRPGGPGGPGVQGPGGDVAEPNPPGRQGVTGGGAGEGRTKGEDGHNGENGFGGRGGPTPPRRTTPAGAGPELGNYGTRQEAVRAARNDVSALRRAWADEVPVPDTVWRRLAADAGDPDYTAALYEGLGPAGTADLIKAAATEPAGRAARLRSIEESLGPASHHVAMTERWLGELLSRAERNGDRAEVMRILGAAAPSARTSSARPLSARTGHAPERPADRFGRPVP